MEASQKIKYMSFHKAYKINVGLSRQIEALKLSTPMLIKQSFENMRMYANSKIPNMYQI